MYTLHQLHWKRAKGKYKQKRRSSVVYKELTNYSVQFNWYDLQNVITWNNIFKYLNAILHWSCKSLKMEFRRDVVLFLPALFFLFLSWGVTGNTKGWQENLQWQWLLTLGLHHICLILLNLCAPPVHFSWDVFEVSLDLFQALHQQHISSFDEWPSRSTATILNLNYSSGPFLWVRLPMPFLRTLWGDVLWSLEGTSALA